nr:MAG: replication associated protein [Virus sp.]
MYVMATVPKKYVNEGRSWLNYFRSQDCHKWIIALEHGANGLIHWQLRWQQRQLDTKEQKTGYFNAFKLKFPQAHIEFTENWCDYERKEGWFVTSDDNPETIKIRFGVLNQIQKEILHTVENQGDRQIDCWYDPKGNHGKSWLTIHLFEKGKGFPVFVSTANQTIADICSGYRGQQYIIIDIPRSKKIPADLYELLERAKDGLVHNSRYSDHIRNIRGAKIIVFTNKMLDKKRLSYDRWRLHGISGDALP